jgi:hypothetical protein
LPGETFHESISRKLQIAKVVVVIWTENSVKSNWVRDEANVGLERGVLIPVRFGNVNPPIGFRSIQAVPLDNWGRVAADPAFDSFLMAVRRNVERQPTPISPSAQVPAPAPAIPQPIPSPQKPLQNTNKNVLWFGIGGAVLLFVIILLGVWYLISSGSFPIAFGSTDTPTPSPTSDIPTDTLTPTPTPTRLENVGQGGGEDTITPTPTDTPRLSGIIPYWEDPSLWFPTANDIAYSPQLIPQTINLITNEEASYGSSDLKNLFESWGRVNSYERFYSHPQLCNSSDLKGLYIQLIFFEDEAGAIDFYSWAHEGADVKFIDYVGKNAYIYTDDNDTRETDCPVSYYSISFQRGNAFGRVRVRSLPGTMTNEEMRKIGKPLAIQIDEKFQAYAP